MKQPLLVICGPTACGKTDVSIKIAKKLNAEIISADSMQVYKYMNIGTAKPSTQEMQGIKHYLIDELNPDDEFSIVKFQQMAKAAASEIYEKGKIPILVGGTGFYINAFVNNNEFTETETNTDFRNELWQLAEIHGNDYIHNKLREVDSESAEKIHANNIKRVIRALEYYHQTNEKISEHNIREKEKTSYYNTTFVVLNMEREKLYNRIELRIENMIKAGLIEEVKWLLNAGYSKDLVSMKGLGYKEIVTFLKGECSLDDAISVLKRDTRHFAKRQITWFKNQCQGLWINVDEMNNNSIIEDEIINYFAKQQEFLI